MPAISVGSVEVDVLPNATGVRQRMQQQLLPAADSVGDELGRVLGRYVTSHLARAVVQGVTNGGRQAQVAAGRQGQATGSTFGRMFKARLEAALATLPEVRLRADSSDAEREIYQIRAQMRALADARIGIDVSTATANEAIARLQERLARLSASDADVAVRVDAGAASAQLAAFQSEVNRLDGQSVDINVDTRSAAANFNLLTTAALAFGPAILPVLPVVAAGLGAVAAAGVAAAAGIGGIALVAIPAFKGIASTLQAQKAAQDAATNATLQGGRATSQAAIAQAKYQAELAKLTPAARETMKAYTGLRDATSAWSKSLQPAVMPIFTRALNGVRRALPGLTPFVLAAADAIGGLQDRASRGFKSPWWLSFKKDLETSVGPAITGLGVGFGNVFKGMVGVVDAFLPHMDSISSRALTITGRFAKWGTSLKGSPEFERFLAYSADKGPVVASTLGKIFSAFLGVGKALGPFSTLALQALGIFADGVSWIAQNLPGVIQVMYGYLLVTRLWAVATLGWAAAQRVATIAMTAFNIVSKAGPWGWIVLAIAAVVIAVVLMYKKFDWFRNAVQYVWNGLKGGAQAVLGWFKGPFVGFFTKTLPGAFQTVLNWVKANWPWLVGALGGPMGLAVVAIIKHWGEIKAGFSSAWDWIKRWVFSPMGTFFTKTIPGWATSLQVKMVAAFNAAVSGIKTGWDKLKAIAKAPVQYVVDVVYNTGIRGVWNKIAGAFGAPKLPEFKFARGGVMPGYTPGRDVHRFVSPTGGSLELAGGEAIMRPEFTRAVGSGFVNTLNSIARSRGAQGIKAALAPAFGGNPMTPTDRSLKYADGGVVQRFADGGIFGWIKSAGSAVLGAGSAAWNKIKESASWLKDTLEASARAGVQNVVDPLLKSFPGMDTGIGQLIRHIPNKIVDALFGYTKKADEKGGGGLGGPKIQAALRWAKTQAGLPYQWAGNGNPSWDCSGFMSAIESVLRGEKPHRRWATMAFSGKTAPPGWVYHGNSPFRIGITNAGVGHTAGTLGGTNVESRGGDGLVVGPRARGYNNSLFTSWYGFKPGSYDSGGYLQPGLNLAFNGTGRPEPVFTRQQANALTSMAAHGQSGPTLLTGDLYLDSGEFLGKVRGEATAVVHQEQQRLISVITAS